MAYIPKNMETASQKAFELGKDLVEAYRTKRQYPEQAALQKAFTDRFCFVVTANKDLWIAEYDHYLKKGWLK